MIIGLILSWVKRPRLWTLCIYILVLMLNYVVHFVLQLAWDSPRLCLSWPLRTKDCLAISRLLCQYLHVCIIITSAGRRGNELRSLLCTGGIHICKSDKLDLHTIYLIVISPVLGVRKQIHRCLALSTPVAQELVSYPIFLSSFNPNRSTYAKETFRKL